MPISTPFDPHSASARQITDLMFVSFGIAAVIFLLVAALVVYAIFRFRWRPEDGLDEPKQTHGNRKLEIGWTIAPAVVFVGVSLLMIPTMKAGRPADGQAVDIVVTGYQWWWDVQYPQSKITTANEIHIPTGRPVVLEIHGGDVIHAFWVPQLGREMDMNPGHVNRMTIGADKPGTYLGACAEFCGQEHAWMRLRVVAQTPEDFAIWQRQQQAAHPVVDDAGRRGQELFQKLTCVSCHAIGGVGAQVGPNLNHLGSRQTLGAGVIDNSPDNLARWIRNPHAIKPAVLMPNLQLTEAQINDLVAYMEKQ
ncbi:MAG: cytochrome c oxidase subunit II [Herpetosiphon sp.]